MEKKNFIGNPLTIIGIFCGLAELAGTTILPVLELSLQKIFVWYVIGFPVLLVVLFFATLNFNRQALYAPSDFADQRDFLKIFFKNIDKVIEEKSKENPEQSNSLKVFEEIIERAAKDIPQGDIEVFTNFPHSQGKENDAWGNLIINGKRIKIWQNKTIIGKSSDADICIRDLSISRIHCIIYRENDKYYLQDAHSTNGTACDGYALKQDSMVELRENSVIMIGNVFLDFERPLTKKELESQFEEERRN